MNNYIGEETSFSGWEEFVSIVHKNPTARPIALEAWNRCKELGLQPNELKFNFLSNEALNSKIEENATLIEVAKPYMDSLTMSLTGIPHIVALSDREGWIIDFRGTPEELGGKSAGLGIGASWSEASIGNNGIGTALATRQAILVYGIEHFGMIYGECACIGVPITYNNEIVGALDISVHVKYANPLRLHIAVACVKSIEASLSSLTNNRLNASTDINTSAISELMATAVHDLKNPLAVIRGLGQLGNLNSDKPTIRNYFDRIIKQVDEMNSMVIELLSIFKPEELIPQKIVPIIDEVLQSFEPICNSKHIRLLFNKKVDACVNLSERLFKRTIENLVNNAVQVMENDGFIEVKTELSNDSIIISIIDSAGGIPEEIKETLFEPFSFRRSGGTGLGLFMAYHSVSNTHKGEIWFETQPGEGTTFFIKLLVSQEVEVQKMKQYQLI
jgi:transcriptional regulator of acetoin/glycerol metabolism